MKKWIPLLVYCACVFISWKFCAGYWVVGSVFAAAVLIIHARGQKLSAKHLVFVVASTLIYALVFWMADKGWKFKNDWMDRFAGALTAGVAAGSLLMTSVHAILFGTDSKTTRSTAFAMIASWYAVITLSGIHDAFDLKLPVSYSLIAIAFWQGIYLRRLKV